MSTPLRGHPEAQHFCGKENCGTNVPGKTNPFCSQQGPLLAFASEQPLSCMRIDGHKGAHAAYQLSISQPVEWS